MSRCVKKLVYLAILIHGDLRIFVYTSRNPEGCYPALCTGNVVHQQ